MIYRNRGDGSFSLDHASYDTEGLICSLALGDIDADNDLDIVVLSYNQLVIYRNRGDGRFLEGENYGIDNIMISVALGDIDEDGDLDIAVVTYNYLIIYIGVMGSFQRKVIT